MPNMIGYMATWTTYGTWLQGNKKGYVKNGTILEADPELEESNEKRLRQNKIKIPKKYRLIVEEAILKEAERIEQSVYAITVCSNHVHIVVKSIMKTVGYSVGQFKRAATHELRKYGFENKIWTKDTVIMKMNSRKRYNTLKGIKINRIC